MRNQRSRTYRLKDPSVLPALTVEDEGREVDEGFAQFAATHHMQEDEEDGGLVGERTRSAFLRKVSLLFF